MSTGKVALGVVAGLAAGAVIGILFAPEKGEVTRQRIAEKGKGSLEGLKGRYNDVIENLSAKLEAVKRNGMNQFSDAMEYAEDTQNGADRGSNNKM